MSTATVVLAVVLALGACGSAKKAQPSAQLPWPQATKAALVHLQSSETAIADSLGSGAPVADTASLCKTGLGVLDNEVAPATTLLYTSPGPPSSVDASGTLQQQQGAENLGTWLKVLANTLRPSMSRCADGVLLDPNNISVDIRREVTCPYALNQAMKDVDLWLAGEDIPGGTGNPTPGQCSAP